VFVSTKLAAEIKNYDDAAAAAERTAVVVTQPGRTRPCRLTVPAADRRVIE